MTQYDVRGSGQSADPYYYVHIDADSLYAITNGTKYIQTGGYLHVEGVSEEHYLIDIVSVTGGGLSVSQGEINGYVSGTGTITIITNYEDDEGSTGRDTYTLYITNVTKTVSLATNPSGKGTFYKRGSSSAITSVSVPYGASISVFSNTMSFSIGSNTVESITISTQSGYKFSSWSPQSGTITSSISVTANLTQTYTVSGTVTSDGTAVGGVTVWLREGQNRYSGLANSNGQYSVDVAGTGTYTITVNTVEYEDYSDTIVVNTNVTKNISLVKKKFTVTIQISGSGEVYPYQVTNVPYGTRLSTSGNKLYVNGTVVTATPLSGASFSGWNNGTAVVTHDFIVTAIFSQLLTVNFTDSEHARFSQSSLTSVPEGTTYTTSTSNKTISFANSTVGYSATVYIYTDSGYQLDGISPSGSGTISSGLTFTLSTSVIPVTSIEIYRNGTNVTNTNIQAVRGRKVILTSKVEPSSALPTGDWTKTDGTISGGDFEGSVIGVSTISFRTSSTTPSYLFGGHSDITVTSTVTTSNTAICRITAISGSPKFTMNYYANGGEGGDFSDSKNTLDLSVSFNIRNGPTKPNALFMGWAETNGGAAAYQPGGIYTFIVSETDISTTLFSKSLYAVWKEGVEITLHPEGGTVDVDKVTAVPSGSAFHVDYLPTPERYGYEFIGWYSSGGVQYTTMSEFTADITDLYARYRQMENGEGMLVITRNLGTDSNPIIRKRTFHLDHIQSIEDAMNVNVTAVSTIVFGVDNRFVIDTGNQQKFNLEIARTCPSVWTGDNAVTSAGVDITVWDAYYDQFFADTSFDRTLSNGIWIKLFKQAIDFWQNFGLDDATYSKTGGMKLIYVPEDQELYPMINKNVFISGGIGVQYGVQKMSFNLPLQVARMVTGSSTVEKRTITLYKDSAKTESEVYSYPVNTKVPLPGPASVWSEGTSDSFDHWVEVSSSTTYMPGDIVEMNNNREYYAVWSKVVCAIIHEADTGLTAYPSEATVRTYLDYNVPDDTPNFGTASLASGRGSLRVIGYAVGGGGGAGGYIIDEYAYSVPGTIVTYQYYRNHVSGGGGGSGGARSRIFNITNGLLSWEVGSKGTAGSSNNRGRDGGLSVIEYDSIRVKGEGGEGGYCGTESTDTSLGRFIASGGSGGNIKNAGGSGAQMSGNISATGTGSGRIIDYDMTVGGNGVSPVNNPDSGGTGAATSYRKNSGNPTLEMVGYAYSGGGGGGAAGLNMSFNINGTPYSYRSLGGDAGAVIQGTEDHTKTKEEMNGTYGGGGGSAPYDGGDGGNGLIIILVYDTPGGS